MVLDKICRPNDIKDIPDCELDELASEIRNFIIEKVSCTGGHLASNLGVVELTMALHKCLDFPKDKLIWDVGHQSYTHKILTGRKDCFDSLRKLDGMSGFPKREESLCDCFDTGHSSTSISAGLGMVKARELMHDNYRVISVIGDGSLTGGLAFEALNNASAINSNFTIILNDNHMSISENVGGMSRYLAFLRTKRGYNDLKEGIISSLNKIPAIGEGIVKNISKTKSMIKQVVIPGMLFENMGITYLGPIDGHDIAALTEVIRESAKLDRAVLIHVITEKGRGYIPAERHPDMFHGVAPFDTETGKALRQKKTSSYTDIFSRCICKEAENNSRITAITAAMKEGTGLSVFAKKYPERFIDVGIAEEHAVTYACGMAVNGMHPVVAVYSSFLQRGFDEVLHDMCIQNLPVTLMLDRAGLVGDDGETHQGIFDISYLSMIPNMAVFAPKNRYEFAAAFEFAVNYNGPMAIRYPKTCAIQDMKEYVQPIELGKSETLIKGKDIALIALGTMVKTAMEAAQWLESRGYCPTVVNLRFASPLDTHMLDDILDHHHTIFTLEENVLSGGAGEHISRYVHANSTYVRVICIGVPDCYVKQGSIDEQKRILGLDTEGVCSTIEKYL